MDTVLEYNNFLFNSKQKGRLQFRVYRNELRVQVSWRVGNRTVEQLYQENRCHISGVWAIFGDYEQKVSRSYLLFYNEAKPQFIRPSVHLNIQVELRYSTQNIEFLDALLSIKKINRIITALYSITSGKHCIKLLAILKLLNTRYRTVLVYEASSFARSRGKYQ